MSASLVGSEMCIRDSVQAPKDFADLDCKLGTMGIDVGFPWDWGGSLEAVSYTHLTLPTICSV
eukprot:12903484-Alexandrium_andersonii.AAC.1